jgi:hypothetical protein
MICSRLEEQALRSAAHLVAALADRRFGAKALSEEVRDSISVLRGELDELGLLAEYRHADGSLAAWRPEDDGNITTALRRASFKDDKPSDPAYLYRVML